MRPALALLLLPACTSTCAEKPSPAAPGCVELADQGPKGSTKLRADVVVSGLEVPWSLAFLGNGDLLVSERPGRVRLVHARALVDAPVLTLPVRSQSEAGLLGIAVKGRALYLYVSVDEGGATRNRVERWTLSEDARSATRDRTIFAGIAGAAFHDGGRLRFGPDGMLYVATGDARDPDSAQRRSGPNGKLLRLTPEGAIPEDNPFAGEATFLWGIRNLQAFDWLDERTLVLADHGPSGELGRTGHDELDLARAGDDLGWPTIFGCQAKAGMVSPMVTWTNAVPPGGGAIVRGDAIPGWKGSFVLASLGARALHRFVLAGGTIGAHEVYFEGDPPAGLGRLRDVVSGPDGALWITTSNCDGRGTCPGTKDAIVRIVGG